MAQQQAGGGNMMMSSNPTADGSSAADAPAAYTSSSPAEQLTPEQIEQRMRELVKQTEALAKEMSEEAGN